MIISRNYSESSLKGFQVMAKRVFFVQQLVAFQSYNPVQNYFLVQNYFHCSKSWIAIKLADLLADLPADLLIQLSILC